MLCSFLSLLWYLPTSFSLNAFNHCSSLLFFHCHLSIVSLPSELIISLFPPHSSPLFCSHLQILITLILLLSCFCPTPTHIRPFPLMILVKHWILLHNPLYHFLLFCLHSLANLGHIYPFYFLCLPCYSLHYHSPPTQNLLFIFFPHHSLILFIIGTPFRFFSLATLLCNTWKKICAL